MGIDKNFVEKNEIKLNPKIKTVFRMKLFLLIVGLEAAPIYSGSNYRWRYRADPPGQEYSYDSKTGSSWGNDWSAWPSWGSSSWNSPSWSSGSWGSTTWGQPWGKVGRSNSWAPSWGSSWSNSPSWGTSYWG